MGEVIGLGSGGHAKVIIEILQLTKEHKVVGLLDTKPELLDSKVLGIPVIGTDDLLPQLYQQGIYHAFIGVGSVGNTKLRQKLYQKLQNKGFKTVSTIHPQAIISNSATIGNGPTIMANVVINCDASLGNNVIINTSAIIEHDCIIGDHVHVASGARLAGGVKIGEGTHIGLGASVIQGIEIGKNTIIGAGAVVLDNVPDEVVVVGVPAKIIKKMKI